MRWRGGGLEEQQDQGKMGEIFNLHTNNLRQMREWTLLQTMRMRERRREMRRAKELMEEKR